MQQHKPLALQPWFAAVSIVFWTVLALLFAVQYSASGTGVPFPRQFAQTWVLFSPCILLTPAVAWIAHRFRFDSDSLGTAALAHLAGLVGLVVIGGAMMGAVGWLLPWLRRGSIADAASRGIVSYLAMDALIYLFIVLSVLAFTYSREAQEKSLAAARLQGQLAESRLHVLGAQLQPHFLFNTLNAISALIREDPQQAERLLARLSDLLRHSLRESSVAETSLKDELDFLEKYVEVQETRFGPRLNVHFRVDDDVLDTQVPRLILQPLVENAIRHGIAPRPGRGTVEIVARASGDSVQLSVSDDGLGLSETLREGVGLRTTRERLQQLYGDRQQFHLRKRASGGTECLVQLPRRRSSSLGAA